MKLPIQNAEDANGSHTYIVSYTTESDMHDHYEIFSPDASNYDEAVARYYILLSSHDVYTASMSIEIATTECR